ncbi:endo alpha-1,4 polygalactosaminidase [Paenibacillus aurantius]|uniref:Endo alpha-1,4 polygalactosaminidase n=1 Tax=Paenibacillus aurantius TaxID=2918900 RepID=A0AA96RF68_9BACL|nr:endo alpha-1,4 polygalactosaminidase [Paenibacillus aurantius]WNQ10948.1 endo alpha-1,4 polygalactosaminidase [Paenibacillus aurantius]
MKKLSVALFAFLVAFSLSGFTAPPAQASGRSALEGITSYKIFYGTPTRNVLDQMKNYQMVIVEPLNYTKEQITQIRKNGTKVMGYINSMEVDKWNKAFLSKMRESDFAHRGGERVYFEEWDSYLTNIASSHYQQLLIDEIRMQITDKGLDGVFFDTVGDIDDQYYDRPAQMAAQQQAMADFFREVKKQNPALPLIQNWGIGTLLDYTAPYVDGFMWESFDYGTIQKDDWAQEQIQALKALQKRYPITVFTVSFTSKAKSTSYSRSLGLVPYHAAKEYVRW